MKQYIILIAITVLPIVAQSQWALDSMPYKNTLKINNFELLHHTLFYERAITTHTAVEAAVGGHFRIKNFAPYSTGMFRTSISIRGYVANWQKICQPFLQGGLCYLGGYGSYDIFINNDGWTINTYKYKLSENILLPFIGLGFRITTGTDLMIELSAQIPLSKRFWFDEHETVIFHELKQITFLTQMFCMKVGWTF